jgi:tetratricopeptide (TPR) repeat protein
MAKAARFSPQDLGAAIQEALALHRLGRLDEAEKIYSRVLKAHPGQFDALHLCGMLKLQRGRVGEAFRLITEALKVDPRSADAHCNLGLVLNALKRGSDAIESFERALALEPDHVEALNNRGRALVEAGRAAEALACFDHALRIAPRHVEAQINRGNALLGLGRHEEAIAEYDKVLAVQPNHPGAHFNRGNALAELSRYPDAVVAYERALAVAPGNAKALKNCGVALTALNRHRDALACYDRALALDRSDADAHFNRALAILGLGDYRAGFAAYEWRWKRSGMPPRRNLGRPLWLGEYPLARKTILLHAEQGLGDTIHFIRYAALLARAGATVVVEAPRALASLLARVSGVAQVVEHGAPLPRFDVHCPIASLPLALRTEPHAIPADIPYVSAAEELLARWQTRLETVARPRIALAWSGSAIHVNDRNRSIALARLDPLLSVAGAGFISVQRDLRAEDQELIERDRRIVHVGAELADFDDTAAVLALADLTICVDTSVAHLAAAMGRPTWIMLPFAPDWRWTLAAENTPWYPAARLFRQHALGDWDGVIRRVRDQLAVFTAV